MLLLLRDPIKEALNKWLRRRIAALRGARLLAAFALMMPLSGEAIIGGDPAGDPPDSPQLRVDANTASSPWAGVGSVVVNGGAFSGALISPRHVITAAHVVAGNAPAAITFNLNAGGDLPHRLHVEQIHIHPGYEGLKPNGSGIARNDLAIIELAEAAPSEIPNYPLLRQPILPGTIITFVGYGAGGDGVHGASVPGSASVKRTGANRADYLLPENTPAAQRDVYLFDFDGPDLRSNRLGVSVPMNGTLGNRIEATLGSGDSGSPAFIKLPLGGWHLVGVNTFVQRFKVGPEDRSRFGNGGGGMLLYPQLAWIEGIVKAAKR